MASPSPSPSPSPLTRYPATHYRAALSPRSYPELAGKLSPLQREAMDLFNEIANDESMKMTIRLQRGDIALINNINVMHSVRLCIAAGAGVAPAEPRASGRGGWGLGPLCLPSAELGWRKGCRTAALLTACARPP